MLKRITKIDIEGMLCVEINQDTGEVIATINSSTYIFENFEDAVEYFGAVWNELTGKED